MNKQKIEKNILDLKYRFQMERIHASLTLLTIGVLAFIGTFIWYIDRLTFGIAISVIVIVASAFYYTNAKKQLKRIVKDIRKLTNTKNSTNL